MSDQYAIMINFVINQVLLVNPLLTGSKSYVTIIGSSLQNWSKQNPPGGP